MLDSHPVLKTWKPRKWHNFKNHATLHYSRISGYSENIIRTNIWGIRIRTVFDLHYSYSNRIRFFGIRCITRDGCPHEHSSPIGVTSLSRAKNMNIQLMASSLLSVLVLCLKNVVICRVFCLLLFTLGERSLVALLVLQYFWIFWSGKVRLLQ